MLKQNDKYTAVQRVLAGFLTLLIAFATIATATLAWTNFLQHKTNSFFMSASDVGTTKLLKLEKDIDGKETETPIAGAEFLLYKKETDGTTSQINGVFTTSVQGVIDVSGLGKGNYYFLETHAPYPYEYDKDSSGSDMTKYEFEIKNMTDKIIVTAYNKRQVGSLTLEKTVKNIDGTPLTIEQKALAFEFVVTFDDNGTYEYTLTDGTEHQHKSGEVLRLKHGEQAVFNRLPAGLSYSVIENRLPGYLVTSENHTGNVQTGGTNVLFTNIYDERLLDYGNLEITKEIVPKTGLAIDTAKEFEFTITFADSGTYNYTLNDTGTLHAVESGKTILLKHGDKVLFKNLPAGLRYTVSESDYESDGYTGIPQRFEGEIIAKSLVQLPFMNAFDDQKDPSDVGILTLSKTIQNVTQAEKDTEFLFKVTFTKGDNVEVPQTITYMKNGEKHTFINADSIPLKHGESLTFSALPVGIHYEIEEIGFAEKGYKPVFEKVQGVISKADSLQVDFINVRVDIVVEQGKLLVRKLVTGNYPSKDEGKEFEFTVKIDGVETVFTLKHGEEKEFVLPKGAMYEVTEKNYTADGYVLVSIENGFGIGNGTVQTATATNKYAGRIDTEIHGEKTWAGVPQNSPLIPKSIVVHLKQGDTVLKIIEVVPNKNGKWTYSFTAPKYDNNGNEIKYSVVEMALENFTPTYNKDNIDIVNTYISSITYEPVVKKEIIGDKPVRDMDFTFVLTPLDNAPQSTNASVVITNGGSKAFGELKFTKAGTYRYQMYESNDKISGITYDKSVWILEVVVIENGGLILQSATYSKDNVKYDSAVFTNAYSFKDDNGNNETTDPNDAGNKNYSSGSSSGVPWVGDASSPTFWLVVLIAASVALRYVLFYAPKKKEMAD